MKFSSKNHIYNVAKIVKIIREKRQKGKKPEEANLYEKVNLIFKGAEIGSPELVSEIMEIIREQNKSLEEHLTGLKKQLQKA